MVILKALHHQWQVGLGAAKPDESVYLKSRQISLRQPDQLNTKPNYRFSALQKIMRIEKAGDFLIQGPKTHGTQGVVNLFGIESPELTSCLGMADELCVQLKIAND